ncbi:MAG: EsaB/YukD family protein [Ktedonobacteraceae bacterium]
MQTVLITLIGPMRRIDVQLPAEVATEEILPKIVELCGLPQLSQTERSEWRLVLPEKRVALPPTQSLLACGVVDGAILLLQDHMAFIAKQREAEASAFRPQALSPSAGTGGIGVKWNVSNR